MPELLRSLYRRIPLSAAAKKRLKSWVPYPLIQPNPALRSFGAVQELYPWRLDGGLDTRFYVQNFYSVFFPRLETGTRARVWAYDDMGRLIAELDKELGPRQTLEVSMQRWMSELGRREDRGTLMWHIALPKAVARLPECSRKHAYFVDRGYFAFVKDGTQPTFVHGVDRYAVFQREEDRRFDPYYRPDGGYAWNPEIPLGPSLGCARLDVLTVNRTERETEVVVRVLDKEKAERAALRQRVPPKGLFLQSVDGALVDRLEDAGSLSVSGLPTQWSRIIVLRHFAGGAVSAMHC